MAIDRRTLLTRAAQISAAAAAATAGATTSAHARTPAGHATEAPGDDTGATALWREYAADPYRHPQIPNVSYAGHATGARWPHLPVHADVLDYGAAPDGSADAAPAINKAIEDVGRRGGGAVLVPAGTYRIDDVVRIGYSNVVLRGEGSDRTTLYATRSLEQIIGINRSRYGSDNSAWSWSGALVWVCPAKRYQDLVDAIQAHDWPFEGWTGNERDLSRTITTATAPAVRGDFSLGVADTRDLHVGRRVLLQIDDDADHTLLQHMSGDGPGTRTYLWSDKTKLLSYAPFVWPVRIAKVDHGEGQGGRVTFAQPLPVDARMGWNPRLTTLPEAITGSGVEGLTVRMVKTPRPKHLQDKGYNGLAFQCAWDCWADDVHVIDVDNGLLLVSTKNVTLSRTRVSGRGSHHSYACREQSHDNLVRDFTVDAFDTPPTPGSQHHGINVEGLSCGNVWKRGHMDAGTFDSHRGLPFANVRTDITIYNDGAHGGSADAGPLYGARFAHWNVTVTNKRAGCVKIDDVAPFSATVGISEVTPFGQIDKADFAPPLNSVLASYGTPGITPPDLHAAQVELRRRQRG
jgi:Pectate lyase superfamily protein